MAEVEIKVGARFDTLTHGELSGELDRREARAAAFEREQLRGIKIRRLPPLFGAPVNGVLDMGGDTPWPAVPGGVPAQAAPCGPPEGYAWVVRLLAVNGLAAASSGQVSAGGAQVVPAGPGTVIATFNAPVTGTYTISVNTAVNTAVAADKNNMQLNLPGGVTIVLPVATAGQGTEQSQPVTVNLTAGQTVTVTQIGATTAAGYFAIINANYATSGDQVSLYIQGQSSSYAWWTFSAADPNEKFARGQLLLMPGERLHLKGSGLVTASQVALIGTAEQAPAEMIAKLR